MLDCVRIDAIEKFDVMADLPIHYYVGSRSAQESLKPIPTDQMPKFDPLEERDRYCWKAWTASFRRTCRIIKSEPPALTDGSCE